jgi:hypothetical protein
MNRAPGVVRLEGCSRCAHVIVAGPGPSDGHYRVSVMSDRIESARGWPVQGSLDCPGLSFYFMPQEARL